ncbi:Angiopoietin-related protein 1,Ficolin-1-A,Angiopoietin-1,Fibrinogen C domain-containing protein 1,Ryncolin-1,Angiopoietin-related protein 7,Fibrinogen C domain-containing protein 1-B,Fibrinogen-like protein 1,Ficolin-1,Ficolin-1-B,Angiopoietin-4,Tenascin-R,Ryncolin-2,Fibrinogen C domain-containing protein 1-A,Microfibril-associated glycoprotein 4,Fibrinogen-like protein A,Ryncolin-3,Angiopoietin-2,Ficolin-2,Fibrinogen alpha chain,Tenascin,Angiopoietin-related protein 2,Techylectin-5A,Ryncolin-4,Techylecti|uniref:Fibrinogen C-terminal domain-containing protein n=1 Tax=Mytilus edulis TaxID=6550 RepID=A0A8S3RXR9_MYTED|nr:Angiopoietin-related protein 1,Ficolin-1-A,Angiopoietin-1,Fibrinogen C domain-containing protein 1,Ryncolin-1,Angiopoietin-related protein 7,Fibrinogen C domain-containing protein 1-B,Fibrinogen-like protein 1,Ficolin-1,Ficolin-1-B,Angiopoietin-4,Tenascin-R,Ryncolin-2,Fibrinogen C domain-containing protein 1-A,Microfibril-associated glycoprotein 4,Fibrinogen-like protein A,Ryncolin-3,Angiopoietin-2,Ficolin-2,Fibrinogen alpha chain,Tenascin,Angiopoietin-related protein 2,Techylectin-5A,Ryncolin-4
MDVLQVTMYGGHKCLSCTAVESANDCNHQMQCDENELCYMHHYISESGSSGFDYGCATQQVCSQSIGTIFGRRSEGHHAKCTLCCDDSMFCNADLNCSSTPQTPSILPRECADLKLSNSGVHTIYPYGEPSKPMYCFVDDKGHIWTAIQRRFDGSVNFYRGWHDYKNGFGQASGEHWIGNDIIHAITADSNYALIVLMTDYNNVTKYAEYLSFHVDTEENGYRLMLGKYTGNAGDSMIIHNGQKFSTYDKDNDVYPGNCAQIYKGAWWYSSCVDVNLNGLYLRGPNSQSALGVIWLKWHGYDYSLKTTTMMIRKY